MLEIKDLYVNYGAVHTLNGVSMTVKAPSPSTGTTCARSNPAKSSR